MIPRSSVMIEMFPNGAYSNLDRLALDIHTHLKLEMFN